MRVDGVKDGADGRSAAVQGRRRGADRPHRRAASGAEDDLRRDARQRGRRSIPRSRSAAKARRRAGRPGSPASAARRRRQGPSLRFAFGTQFFKYLVFNDPVVGLQPLRLRELAKDTALAATFLNATNPDLDAFKAKGGKLIMWHGWSDPALTALGSIKYYEQVQARDAECRDYFRMFMMPGVLHCAGGPGPDTVDWTAAIDDWVENGKAPDRVIARKAAAGGAVSRTRRCVRIRSMRSTRAPAARTTRRTSSAGRRRMVQSSPLPRLVAGAFLMPWAGWMTHVAHPAYQFVYLSLSSHSTAPTVK